MGRNYRFRLSDMIPNSWFYKLRDMGTTRNRLNTTSNPTNKFRHLPSSSFSSSSSSSSSSKLQPHHRKSYHFTRPDLTFHTNSPIKSTTDAPPRKSSSRRRRSLKRYRTQPTRRQVSTTIAAGCSCRTSLESVWNKPPDSTPEEYANSPDQTTSSSDHDSVMPECGSDALDIDDVVSRSTPCKCKPQNDIVIEMDQELPPIITKKQIEPTKIQRTSAEFSESNAYGSLRVKVVKEDFVNWTGKDEPVKTGKRFPVNSSSSPGVRLRTNSPRILNRRARKSTSSPSNSSVSESFAVVKSSKNPRRDFRESMVEMIVENNIRASKDLEELLACYLSLNSDEYHDMIINVFKQIWFDFIVHVPSKDNN